MKKHVNKHYREKFFESEEKKIAFIRKNAHRLNLRIQTQTLSFQDLAKEVYGYKLPETIDKPQEGTKIFCAFCKVPYQDPEYSRPICQICFSELDLKDKQTWIMLLDGKVYENEHVHQLVYDVLMQLKQEDDKYLANLRFVEPPKKRKQTKLDDLL